MKKRDFGQTGISVSELALGTSPLGGGLFYRNDNEAKEVLRAAFDAGITFFDTAESYGDGLHEQLLGTVFRGSRDNVIIASKGGLCWTRLGRFMMRARNLARPVMAPLKGVIGPRRRSLGMLRDSQKHYEFSPRQIRQSLEGTLRRLNTDYVDVYQFFNIATSETVTDDLFDIMDQLKKEGKIRYGGATVLHLDEAYQTLQYDGMDAIQLPVNIFHHKEASDFLPKAVAKGIAVIGRSPLAGGFLTNQEGHVKAIESLHITEKYIESIRRKREQLFELLDENQSINQLAMQYALQEKGISTVLFSVSNRKELRENLEAIEAIRVTPISDEVMQAAKQRICV